MRRMGILVLIIAWAAGLTIAGDGRIIRPRGGESLVRGVQIDVEWSLTGVSPSATLRLVLVQDVGADRRRVGVIADGLSAGLTRHPWRAGSININSAMAPAGSNYRIKLRVESDGTTVFSGPFTLADRTDRAAGEASFFDLELTRVYVSGDKLAVRVANRGNRGFTAPRTPFSIWINSESGPPTLALTRSLNVPAGGETALQLMPVNSDWCPACCGVPVSVAVNRGAGALAEGNTRNNSKLERLYLKRRDWRMVPLIYLGVPGATRLINARTDHVRIEPANGRVTGPWGQGASIAMNATFRVKNCGNFGSSSTDPHYAQNARLPLLTIQIYQKGVWETVQVRGADGMARPETRFNRSKIRFAGGQSFSASIPIGGDAPLDLPVTLIHPGDQPSSLIILFKDFRRENWGVLGIVGASPEAVFNLQRMEFPLEFR